jgi:putative membrane protein
MLKFFTRLLITMAALKGADICLGNFNLHGGFLSLLVFTFVFGILNWIVKPILVFFSIPLIVLTIGFFYLCINAVILYLASVIMPGELTANAWGIFWGSILMSFFHWMLTVLFRMREKE